MQRLRIALVVNNLNVGGLEKVVISLLRGLDRNRFDVYLICLDGGGRLFTEAAISPDHCLVLNRRFIRFWSVNIDIRALYAIRSFIGKNRIQLIHTHNLSPLIYGGLAARSLISGPLVVYTEHNQIYSASAATKVKYPYYLKLADKVLVVSKDLQNHLQNVIGVQQPVEVMYNGIDGLLFQRVNSEGIRSELGITADSFLVGTAVVISEQKGIRYLMEAAKIVLCNHSKIQFVVAGEGPLLNELKAQLETMGLGDRFRFLGYRDDIPAVISALDLYVLPSLWEGFPLALLEAMAIGKPIVCTHVGGNPEIVNNGENGYLVAPKDAEGLAKKILSIAGDPAFMESVKLQNRSRFESNFSDLAMVAAHENFYEKNCAALMV